MHPQYLDSRGLVALWREALLARRVLLGLTKGYRNHPQLIRFQETENPEAWIDAYLHSVADEADRRNYNFRRALIGEYRQLETIPVTDGQLNYERQHLQKKLEVRDPERAVKQAVLQTYEPHPTLHIVEGSVAFWEKV